MSYWTKPSCIIKAYVVVTPSRHNDWSPGGCVRSRGTRVGRVPCIARHVQVGGDLTLCSRGLDTGDLGSPTQCRQGLDAAFPQVWVSQDFEVHVDGQGCVRSKAGTWLWVLWCPWVLMLSLTGGKREPDTRNIKILEAQPHKEGPHLPPCEEAPCGLPREAGHTITVGG